MLLPSCNNQLVLCLLLVGLIFGGGSYGTIEIHIDGVATWKKSRCLSIEQHFSARAYKYITLKNIKADKLKYCFAIHLIYFSLN